MNAYPIKIDGKYGLIDCNGEVVLEPRFGWIGPMANNRAVAGVDNGGAVMITKTGTIELPPDAKYVFDSTCELSLAKNEDCVSGYLDPEGRWKIECMFHEACSFHFGLAVVKEDRTCLYKVINLDGQDVFSPEWDYISDFSEEGGVGRRGREWFLMRYSGEVTRMGLVNDMDAPSDGVIAYSARVGGKNRWMFLDLDLNPFLPEMNFSSVKRFSAGICAVKEGRGFKLLRKDGTYANEGIYKDAGVFYRGLCPARSSEGGGKWGAVNAAGEWVVPPQYDGCDHLPVDALGNSEITGELIMVWTGDYVVDDGRLGYYDYSGELIWAPRK